MRSRNKISQNEVQLESKAMLSASGAFGQMGQGSSARLSLSVNQDGIVSQDFSNSGNSRVFATVNGQEVINSSSGTIASSPAIRSSPSISRTEGVQAGIASMPQSVGSNINANSSSAQASLEVRNGEIVFQDFSTSGNGTIMITVNGRRIV